MNDRLERDMLVELQDQYSNVYPLSPSGARGWVRAKRELPKADPEVFIEWDKTHWRYHGERDGWTYEHHFRPVDDRTPEVEDEDEPMMLGREHLRRIADIRPSMEEMLAEAARQVESERCPNCGNLHDEADDYINALLEAQDVAAGGEGFLMITITPQQVDGMTYYEPRIFNETLTPSAQKIIDSQLAYMAAALFEQFALDQLNGGQDVPGR